MSDPLMLLHRASGGEAAPGPPPAPEEPGFVEYEVLRTTLAALDAVPRPAPPPATLLAITDEAARAALAAGPHAALGALYAISSTALPVPSETADGAEEALLRSTAAALGTLPSETPSEQALAAIMARARAAAEDACDTRLAPVRYVYGEAGAAAPGPQTAEAAEVAWLDGARRVLETAPKARPAGAAVDAILARARHAALPAAAPAVVPALAADRAAARPARARRQMSGVWAGAFAGLVALVAVAALFRGGAPAELTASSETAAVPAVASAQEAAPAQAAPDADVAALPPPPPQVPAASNEAPAPSTPAPGPAPALAAALVAGGVVPAAPASRPAPPQVPAAPPAPAARAALAATPGVQLASAARPPAEPEAAAWEAAEDVRILSLRLQALREQNAGMGWNEPAEPFGRAPAAAPASFTPGVQAVGTAPAPIRAHVRARVSGSRVD